MSLIYSMFSPSIYNKSDCQKIKNKNFFFDYFNFDVFFSYFIIKRYYIRVTICVCKYKQMSKSTWEFLVLLLLLLIVVRWALILTYPIFFEKNIPDTVPGVFNFYPLPICPIVDNFFTKKKEKIFSDFRFWETLTKLPELRR